MLSFASAMVSAAARDACRALTSSTGLGGASRSHVPARIASSTSAHSSSQPPTCAATMMGVHPSDVTVGSFQRSSGTFARTASNAAAPVASSSSRRRRSGIRRLLLTRGRLRIRLGLVLEDTAVDRHLVAGSRALRRERTVDTFLLETRLQARHLLVVVEIGLHHPTLHLRTLDLPAGVAAAHDEPRTAGSQDHGGRPRRLRRRGLARKQPEPVEKPVDAVA